MSHPLIDALENHGLISSEAVQHLVYELPFKQVCRIREELEGALTNAALSPLLPEDTFSPFNFLASSTLRGDSGCASWACHTRKAEALARYGAVFCDQLIVPLNIGSHPESTSQSDQRFVLARGLLAVLEMRPVIDAGIIIPVRAAHYFCPSCFSGRVPDSARIVEVKNDLYDNLFRKFSITYVPQDKGTGKLLLRGPADYVEHRELRFGVKRGASYLPAGRKGNQSFRLNPEQMQKTSIIDLQFNRMAMDIAAQQVLGLQYNSAYLTDMAGEAEFLKRLDKDDQLATRTANFCAQMSHSVPLFMNLPVETVMRIRREDYEAFASYRSTLRRIITEHVASGGAMDVKQARELFLDTLEPEILNLQQQAKNEQKYGLKKTALKYGLTAAGIGFGAYTGLLATHLTQLVTALGGLKLIDDVSQALTSMEKNPTKVRNSNLYFLLRLKQEQD